MSDDGLRAAVTAKPDFDYVHKGSFAYIGNHSAIAQIPNKRRNGSSGEGQATALEKPNPDIEMKGSDVFFAWRAVYFSKLLGARNRAMVGLDWAKTKIFGRDTSRFD
jgi:NADH:ubiquinone reductase (non-electrogenic)